MSAGLLDRPLLIGVGGAWSCIFTFYPILNKNGGAVMNKDIFSYFDVLPPKKLGACLTGTVGFCVFSEPK